MSFIVLAGGEELVLGYPRNGMLTAANLAHAQALINRFNGHTSRPYSVAEHSLLVCEIAERLFRLPVGGLLAALMHDAHEAVATDMHSPGKLAIGPSWKAWESRWSTQVRAEYALHSAFADHGAEIHSADLMALAIERRDLLNPSATTPWEVLHGIEPVRWLHVNTPEREAMSWKDWRTAWLDRYHSLEYARNEAAYGEPDSGFTL